MNTGETCGRWIWAGALVALLACGCNDGYRWTIDPTKPYISLSGGPLTFTLPQGFPNPTTRTFTISNTGGADATWSAAAALWLTLTPAAGNIPAGGSQVVTVDVNSDVPPYDEQLNAGSHGATITVSAVGAANIPQSIGVTVTVTATPRLEISQSAVTLSVADYITTPVSQNINLLNADTGPMIWTLTDGPPWLTVTPTGGTLNTGQQATLPVSATGPLAVGTYTGTVTITSAEARNGSITVTVTLTVVDAPPVITLSATTFPFTGPENGPFPADQTLNIANTGPALSQLAWTLASIPSWLTPSATTGTLGPGANADVTLSVDTTGLTEAGGPYTAVLTVTDANASNSPQTINVTLNVFLPVPTMTLSTATLVFNAPLSGPNPADQTVTINNTGQTFSVLNWTLSAPVAAWLTVTPLSGSITAGDAPTTITLSVDTTGLAEGAYGDVLTFTAPLVSDVNLTIVLNVRRPNILISPTSLTFTAFTGGSGPTDQSFDITNDGLIGSRLDWTLSIVQDAPGGWLATVPSAGITTTGPDTISVSITSFALPAGTYNGTIAIVDPLATNNPEVVNVTLTVVDAAPDLVVTGMTHFPSPSLPGQSVTFNVTIENQGTAASGSFTLGFWSNQVAAPNAASVPDQGVVVAGLGAGSSGVRSFTIIAPAAGNYTAWAFADSGDVVAELDETNNAGPIGGHAWQVAAGPTPDPYEPDNSFGTASFIPFGSTQTRSLVPAGDDDYVSFTITTPRSVTIETNGPVFGDTTLTLFTSAFAEITYNDDIDFAGGNYWSRITISLAAGTYYILVLEWGDQFGSPLQIDQYFLTVN